MQRMSGEIPWLDSGSVGSAVLKGITIGMLTAILLPAPLALCGEAIRVSVSFAFDEGCTAMVVDRMSHGGDLRGSLVPGVRDALFSISCRFI